MKKWLLFFLFIGVGLIYSSTSFSQNSFVTTWQTTDGTITIPIISIDSLTYNYDIEWTNLTNPGEGDGSDAGVSTSYTISGLNNDDTYEISISGAFPAIYFLGDTDEAPKIQTIEQWGDIQWETMYFAFWACSNLTSNATDAPDLSLVKSMYATFGLATSFNSDLNNWDVSTIENMLGTFFQATSFNGNISNWSTFNVTTMRQMFEGATSFNQNLNGWSVSSVTNMNSMFQNASAFNSPLDFWFPFQVTDMTEMFSGASSFDQSLGDWSIRDVTTMSGMLDNSGLSKVNYDATLRGWQSFFNTPTGITLGAAGLSYCNGADARTTLTGTTYSWTINGDALDCQAFVTRWQTDDGQITIPTSNSETYFYDVSWRNITNPGVGEGSTLGLTSRYTITGLNNGDIYEVSITGDFPKIYFLDFNISVADRGKIISIEQWGDQEWTDLSYSFYNCINLTSNISDTPLLQNVSLAYNMFDGATSFDGDLSNWDVSTFQDVSSMFRNASSFNGNIQNWDVSNITDMNAMFSGATSFNQNIDGWEVSNVTNMGSMFQNATSFNQNLNSWDVSNVTFMDNMFSGATSFNGNISNWSVSRVTSMDRMFSDATTFSGNLSRWNVGNCESMRLMFNNASSFVSDLSNWDVRNVTNMVEMFKGATNFNSDLSDWDISQVTNLGGMFWDASTFNQNLASWDISSVAAFEEERSGVIGIDSIFTNSALSTINYDSTVIGWATLSENETLIPNDLNLGAHNICYCFSEQERSQLINTYNWLIDDAGAGCPTPTIQASNITFSNVSTNQLNVSWENGDGSGRIVIVKQNQAVDFVPTNLSSYSANNDFSNATDIGNNNYVVYVGQGNNFTLTGLSEGTSYHFQIFEYNGANGLEVYNTDTSTGNPESVVTLSTPSITEFQPSSGAIGDTITISGSGFSNASIVSFGGINANSFTVESDNSILAILANGASGEISITSPAGTASMPGFEFILAPVIESFNPDTGTTGDTITILGFNFDNASIVSFGGIDANSFTIISSTEIQALLGNVAPGNVSITTPGGTATKSGFKIIPAPIITSFSPTFASPGDTITINGLNFSNTSSVSFGGINAASFEVISDAEIIAIVSNVSPGNVIVTTPGGSATKEGFTTAYSQITLFEEKNIAIPSNQTATVDIGSAVEGEQIQKPFIINNNGNDDLIITGITSSNSVFEILNAPDTILAGTATQFSIQFSASEIDNYNGEILIENNSFNEPQFSFNVSAELTELNIVDNETDSIIISNQDINLGTTLINVDIDKNFEIENLSAKATISIFSITVDNPVFQIINIPTSIAPLNSAQFTVRLNANEVGEYSGLVNVNTNLKSFTFGVNGLVVNEISREIKVYNVVTPNGDGRHDFLQIDNIAEYPNNKVSIFNRLGNKVFEIDQYNNSSNIFEGTSSNGEELISGNYYYVIDKGNGEKRISGFILIKR